MTKFFYQYGIFWMVPGDRAAHAQVVPAWQYGCEKMEVEWENEEEIVYGPSQYLSLFPSNNPKSKKINFSLISVSARKKTWPIASSISMPPTFQIASLNCHTHK